MSSNAPSFFLEAVGVLRADDRSCATFRLPHPDSDGAAETSSDEVQREHIARVLYDVGGHVEEASHRLQIPRSTLDQALPNSAKS